MKAPNAGRFLSLLGGKALVIPKEGWHAHTFRLNGRALIMTMHRAAMITQRRQTAIVARALSKAFGKQIGKVLDRFAHASMFGRRAAKAEGDVFLPSHEQLLHEILGDVLRDTNSQITAEITPAVQSTLAQGYSKTSILLGQNPFVDAAAPNLQRRARELATRITGLDDTTRKRFQTLLDRAVKEQWSVADTTKAIAKQMPEMQGRRALTIARTELNQAWNEGAIQAFKESKTVTECSVIGCESREELRWEDPSYQQFMYRGESTCNIEGVPVGDIDKLNFHPNHTGTIVATGFIE